MSIQLLKLSDSLNIKGVGLLVNMERQIILSYILYELLKLNKLTDHTKNRFIVDPALINYSAMIKGGSQRKSELMAQMPLHFLLCTHHEYIVKTNTVPETHGLKNTSKSIGYSFLIPFLSLFFFATTRLDFEYTEFLYPNM